jgi:hypothetical protein
VSFFLFSSVDEGGDLASRRSSSICDQSISLSLLPLFLLRFIPLASAFSKTTESCAARAVTNSAILPLAAAASAGDDEAAADSVLVVAAAAAEAASCVLMALVFRGVDFHS